MVLKTSFVGIAGLVKKKTNMSLLKKKCEYCGEKIEKGEIVFGDVKPPELTKVCKKPFCTEAHIEKYQSEVKGTPRRNFCPSCGV